MQRSSFIEPHRRVQIFSDERSGLSDSKKRVHDNLRFRGVVRIGINCRTGRFPSGKRLFCLFRFRSLPSDIDDAHLIAEFRKNFCADISVAAVVSRAADHRDRAGFGMKFADIFRGGFPCPLHQDVGAENTGIFFFQLTKLSYFK